MLLTILVKHSMKVYCYLGLKIDICQINVDVFKQKIVEVLATDNGSYNILQVRLIDCQNFSHIIRVFEITVKLSLMLAVKAFLIQIRSKSKRVFLRKC